MNIFNKLIKGFGLGNDEEAGNEESNPINSGNAGNSAGGNQQSNGANVAKKKTAEHTVLQNNAAQEDYARFMPGYAPPAAQDADVSEKEAVNGSKQANASAPVKTSFVPTTPQKRDAIIGFILNALKPYVDEKGLSVQGLKFYVLCTTQEETEAARVALYIDKHDMFKHEHLERRLINHFIQLEPSWYFESHIVKDALPEDCIKQGAFGIQVIQAGGAVASSASKARILVMVGQAEQHEYLLDPAKKLKFYIGRSKSPQLPSGKIQLNDIIFIAKDEPGFNEAIGMANLHVSRNHAYIQYDARTDRFLLYPDKGGLPENGNKIKVHTADDRVKFLNLYGVAHHLQEGDQIELGGEAVLMYRRLV